MRSFSLTGPALATNPDRFKLVRVQPKRLEFLSTERSLEICILAGGSSSRMGRDKAKIRLGRLSLLGTIRREMKPLALPIKIIRDEPGGRRGPVGGVFAAMQSSRAEILIFLACDMPCVKRNLIIEMLESFTPDCRAIFIYDDGRAGFPFVLRRSTLPEVELQLRQINPSLQRLARAVSARFHGVTEAERGQLLNINSPADLEAARAILGWRDSIENGERQKYLGGGAPPLYQS
jgi:molybdopterin-guanine dinucleotide biosynthesis protein A